MRNVIIVIVAITLFSCHNYKKDAERLQIVRDSIANEAMAKDSAIVGFLADMNEVQATLDSIKTIEKLVMVEKASGVEMPASRKKQIIEDITLLKELLDKNKAQVASLQKKLNNANYKIGAMEKTIAEFEVMVANLTKQIEEKDAQIIQLNDDLKKLHLNIDMLNTQIKEVSEESAQKTDVIEKQVLEMNKAFYAVGTVKELVENGVVDKEGGFLGLGKTIKIKKDFNRDYFSQIDIREFQYLPLMVKKAKVISVHPEGSFHITGEKTADTLFIDNSEEFWKVSKYLLVVSE